VNDQTTLNVILGVVLVGTNVGAYLLYTRFPRQRQLITGTSLLIGSLGMFLVLAIVMRVVFRRLNENEMAMGILGLGSLAFLATGVRMHVRTLREAGQRRGSTRHDESDS